MKMAPFEERIHVQVVVAIDFGTTYSGYAISMDADYKIDPLKASYSFSLSVSHSVSVFLSRSLSLSGGGHCFGFGFAHCLHSIS